MTTKPPKPTSFFNSNGTGFQPVSVSKSSRVDVTPSHINCMCLVTKKGRESHAHVGDHTYADIPESFIKKFYPELVV